jgi:hypothetical protein
VVDASVASSAALAAQEGAVDARHDAIRTGGAVADLIDRLVREDLDDARDHGITVGIRDAAQLQRYELVIRRPQLRRAHGGVRAVRRLVLGGCGRLRREDHGEGEADGETSCASDVRHAREANSVPAFGSRRSMKTGRFQ